MIQEKKPPQYRRTGKIKSHPAEYRAWVNMKTRCYNKNRTNYKHYGGRGIRVCDRWLGADGFDNFFNDMGPRANGMTLDRIDPEKNYSPENCRWADMHVQNINKSIVSDPYIYFDKQRGLYRVDFRSLKLPGKQFAYIGDAREYRDGVLKENNREDILSAIIIKEKK